MAFQDTGDSQATAIDRIHEQGGFAIQSSIPSYPAAPLAVSNVEQSNVEHDLQHQASQQLTLHAPRTNEAKIASKRRAVRSSKNVSAFEALDRTCTHCGEIQSAVEI
ncbi:hypothetical protein RUND412_002627 [Rhizina undulata]